MLLPVPLAPELIVIQVGTPVTLQGQVVKLAVNTTLLLAPAHMMALKGIGRDQTESKTTPIVQPVNKLQDLVVADGTGGAAVLPVGLATTA